VLQVPAVAVRSGADTAGSDGVVVAGVPVEVEASALAPLPSADAPARAEGLGAPPEPSALAGAAWLLGHRSPAGLAVVDGLVAEGPKPLGGLAGYVVVVLDAGGFVEPSAARAGAGAAATAAATTRASRSRRARGDRSASTALASIGATSWIDRVVAKDAVRGPCIRALFEGTSANGRRGANVGSGVGLSPDLALGRAANVAVVRLFGAPMTTEDSAAFHAFYEAHRLAAVRYAATILGPKRQQDADDVAQDAWARAWRSWGRSQPETRAAWFFRIVRNAALDRHRRDRGEVALEVVEPALVEIDFDARLESDEVLALLACLPQKLRETLWLRAGLDLSYAEIAEVLGVPEGTVMSRLSSARKKLAKRMAGRSA
jgi:RNA polymerase sigma-70 factor (ECF subfamily)